MFVQG